MRSTRGLAAVIFAQMLPATLVAPAIRPLFATQHGGAEGPMHAFMALNMLGALVVAPMVGARADRSGGVRRMLGLLCAIDAVLLVCVTAAIPVEWVLGLRLLEGGAHVGAATLLMGEAAARARTSGSGRVMGVAGGALMLAVALGSGLGGAVVGVDPRLPFWLAAGLSAAVAVIGPRILDERPRAPRARGAGARELWAVARVLAIPLGAAFVARFTVGCVVVTFALFAHHAHGLDDAAVGGLFTLLTLPFALGTYPAARLGDAVPRSLVLGLGAAAYAAGLLLLPWVASSWLPVTMLVLGLASAAIFAPILCYSATLAGEGSRARAMALVNGAGCLGMMVGPAVAGITSAVVGGDPVEGYRVVFHIAGGSMALWLVLALPWLVRRWRGELRRTPVTA